MEVRPDKETHMPCKDYERLGAIKLSVLCAYGPRADLQKLCDEYSAYFSNRSNEIRNEIVFAYRSRTYQDIYPLS